MKPRQPSQRRPEAPARDPDFAGAEAAMRRAAERARRRAAANGVAVAVFEDGRVVWVKADGEASP